MKQAYQTYVLMWDMNGLESIVNYPKYSSAKVWQALKGGDPHSIKHFNLMHWQLRAQFNPQRHYEIYSINVDESIDQNYFVNAFKESPQAIVDLIRKRGTKIYSDRATGCPIII